MTPGPVPTVAPAATVAVRSGVRRAGWLALLVLLAGYALFQLRADAPYRWAFDLYHPWGIREAQASLGARGNPYTNTAPVGAFVAARAAESTSAPLQAAASFWQMRSPLTRFEPTGTPFYYALFAFMPRDYDAAYARWPLLQLAAAAVGIFLLCRLRGWRPLVALCVAALAWGLFNPLAEDLKYGNVNALQFLALACFITVSQRGVLQRRPWLDASYLPLLALFVLAKPNAGLIALVLGAHYAVTRGARRTAIGAGFALVALAAGIAVGAVYFGHAGIWRDWYLYTQGMNGGTLVYGEGNVSLVKVLSGSSHLGVAAYSAAAGLVLVAAVAIALSDNGRTPREIVPRVRALLADPWLAASLGIIATFLVSPLMWPHYVVLALVPMLRLFRWRGRWDAATTCVVLACVLLSRPVFELMYAWGQHAVFTLNVYSWTPLVAALLAELDARNAG